MRVAHAVCAASLSCAFLSVAALARGGDGPPQQPLRAGSSDDGDAEPFAVKYSQNSRCVLRVPLLLATQPRDSPRVCAQLVGC